MTHKIDLQNIDLIVYDFDGVLTDNRVLVMQDGKEAVFCNRSDGLAIEMLRKQGVAQLILSKETNPVVAARAKKLSLPVLHGVDDKATILRNYCAEHGVGLQRVVYIGNDTNDLEVMGIVGIPVAPSDAHPDIIGMATIVLTKAGGYGVVRELYDRVLTTGE